MSYLIVDGKRVAAAWVEGLAAAAPYVRLKALQLQLIGLRMQAERSTAHADWFCSLPWWRRWWVIVRG